MHRACSHVHHHTARITITWSGCWLSPGPHLLIRTSAAHYPAAIHILQQLAHDVANSTCQEHVATSKIVVTSVACNHVEAGRCSIHVVRTWCIARC